MNLYGEILTEALQGREAEMTRRGVDGPDKAGFPRPLQFRPSPDIISPNHENWGTLP